MLKRKSCPRCKEHKKAELFSEHKANKSGLNVYCKDCVKEMGYNYSLMKTYGITIEDYNEMFIRQNGCCDICKRHQTEINHRLYVDHNHATGEVRALLCNRCNQIVGAIESKDFNTAVEYVNKHQ